MKTKKKSSIHDLDARYPDNREGMLLRRCDDLARTGRLTFAGDGEIHLKRRYYKGRFGSRLFRSAVEVLTRRRSCIFRLREDRRGRPVEVLLHCRWCINRSRYWSPADSRFSLEAWKPAGESADAMGCCLGCLAPVSLFRDHVTGTWHAVIREPRNYELEERY